MFKRKNNFITGLTIIEMMLSLTIGAIILVCLTTIYLAAEESHQYQTALADISENARVVTHLLNSAIQAAGYLGCAKLQDTFPVNTSSFSFTTKNKISNYHSDKVKRDSQAFTVRYLSEEHTEVIKNMRSNSILYVDDVVNLKKDDVVLISDCQSADIFLIKDVLKIENNTQKIISQTLLSKQYSKNAVIGKFTINTYFIGQTERVNFRGEPIYALYVEDINQHKSELVEGVDDMKINFTILNRGNLREVNADKIRGTENIVGVSIYLNLSSLNQQLLNKKWISYTSLRN